MSSADCYTNLAAWVDWGYQSPLEVLQGHSCSNPIVLNGAECKMLPIREKSYKFAVFITVCLLKSGPPRQWKPIRWHNWNNRIQHFQIQPFKCLFSNPANQMSGTKQWNLNLFVVMLVPLWCRLSINYQAQTVITFASNYILQFLWGSWLV